MVLEALPREQRSSSVCPSCSSPFGHSPHSRSLKLGIVLLAFFSLPPLQLFFVFLFLWSLSSFSTPEALPREHSSSSSCSSCSFPCGHSPHSGPLRLGIFLPVVTLDSWVWGFFFLWSLWTPEAGDSSSCGHARPLRHFFVFSLFFL